jgi:hypothetical protein
VSNWNLSHSCQADSAASSRDRLIASLISTVVDSRSKENRYLILLDGDAKAEPVFGDHALPSETQITSIRCCSVVNDRAGDWDANIPQQSLTKPTSWTRKGMVMSEPRTLSAIPLIEFPLVIHTSPVQRFRSGVRLHHPPFHSQSNELLNHLHPSAARPLTSAEIHPIHLKYLEVYQI